LPCNAFQYSIDRFFVEVDPGFLERYFTLCQTVADVVDSSSEIDNLGCCILFYTTIIKLLSGADALLTSFHYIFSLRRREAGDQVNHHDKPDQNHQVS
jgi:hypothetical protein